MTRLVVNATLAHPGSGGISVYTHNVLRELEKLGVDLEVFTPVRVETRRAAVRRISPLMNAERGMKGHLMRMLWSNVLLPPRLAMRRGSVLFAPSQLDVVWRSPLPQVVVVHDLVPLLFPDAYPEQHWFFRLVLPGVLRRAAAIVADSEATRADLVRHYGLDAARISTIPLGIDPRYHPRPRAEVDAVLGRLGLSRFILYVGRFTRVKNPAALLRAFAAIEFDGDCVLVGWGKPRDVQAQRITAGALGIAGRVKIFGRLRIDELAALYTAAEAFVFPSLYEGFGLPPLEAMACGCPAIVSSAPALREIAGPAIVADFKLEASLRALVSDAAMKRDLRRAGIEHAGRFAWSRAAARLADVLALVGRG